MKQIINCLFFSLAIILGSGCNKTTQKNDNVVQGQYAIYTMGFTEDNSNKGIVVVVMLQNGRKLSVDNYVFRYSEGDEQKLANYCNNFMQRITLKDTTITKYETLSNYINSYFSAQSYFKSSGTLTKEQLQQMLKGNSVDLALNEGSKNTDIATSFLHAIIPSAHARTTASSIELGYLFNVLVGSVTGSSDMVDVPKYLDRISNLMAFSNVGVKTFISNITGDPAATISSNNIANILIDEAIGKSIGKLNVFANLGFATAQAINVANHHLINPIMSALDNSYQAPNDLPTNFPGLWPSIVKSMNKYKEEHFMFNILSVATEEPGAVTGSTAIVNATNTSTSKTYSANDIRGFCYSTSPNVTYYNNIGVLVVPYGVGSFSTTLSDLKPNTKYYYCGFAGYYYGVDAQLHIAQGEVKSFTTSAANSFSGTTDQGPWVPFIANGNPNYSISISLIDVDLAVVLNTENNQVLSSNFSVDQAAKDYPSEYTFYNAPHQEVSTSGTINGSTISIKYPHATFNGTISGNNAITGTLTDTATFEDLKSSKTTLVVMTAPVTLNKDQNKQHRQRRPTTGKPGQPLGAALKAKTLHHAIR